MSGEEVDTEPTAQLDDVSIDNSQPPVPDTATPVEDTAAATTSTEEPPATEEVATEDVIEDKEAEETDVESTNKVADEEAPTEDAAVVEKKNENPLEAVGSRFQGLVGGPQQALRQRSTKDVTTEDASEAEKDIENQDAAPEEPAKIELDDHPDDIASKSSSNTSADDDENVKKKGGVRQQIGTYLGTMMSAKKKVEPVVEDVEDAEDGTKVEDKEGAKETIGMGQRINTLWGSMQNTSKHSDKDRALEMEADDDENAKKKGGWRQRIGTLYRSKHGKLGLMVFAFVVILLCIIGPIVSSMTRDTMTTFLKNAGRVEKFLKAQIIKHPSYEGDLYPFGEITLRYDTDDRALVNFRVEGLEEKCVACKWAILEGGSCHDAAELGDTHYYDSLDPLVFEDPYPFPNAARGGALYSANEGKSESVQTLLNGYNLEETINHAIVLYAQDGNPLACGVLKKHGHPMTYPKLYANIKKLPDYPGEVEGKVRIDFYPDKAFHMGYDVKGMHPDSNHCSVAIYNGISCNFDKGLPFWNAEKMEVDPWQAANGVWYDTDAYGTTNRVGFYLYDAFEYADHIDRVVVFKDLMGYDMACGELRDSANYVWKETEAAISGAMEAGGDFVQSASLPNPVVAGVEAIQMVESAAEGNQVNAV